jgi:TIR domain-containing protein
MADPKHIAKLKEGVDAWNEWRWGPLVLASIQSIDHKERFRRAFCAVLALERLHSDLQTKGVRCWYAPEDLKTGDKFRQRIDEAIRIYDKLLAVLSENSIESQRVEDEVEGALEKERQQNKLALFPVRLDDAVMNAGQAWAASLWRTRHIADFTNWETHDSYQNAFKRLLQDLQGKEAATAGERV